MVKIGNIGSETGLLVLTDPSVIPQWKTQESKCSDHPVYKHQDGTLWQFVYGNTASPMEPAFENVNPFPGIYADIIPQYGKSPNEMIADGEMKLEISDPSPVEPGEFSMKGSAKAVNNSTQAGELWIDEGQPVSLAVVSGDGVFPVFAEYHKRSGKITRLIIEFDEPDGEQLEAATESQVDDTQYPPLYAGAN